MLLTGVKFLVHVKRIKIKKHEVQFISYIYIYSWTDLEIPFHLFSSKTANNFAFLHVFSYLKFCIFKSHSTNYHQSMSIKNIVTEQIFLPSFYLSNNSAYFVENIKMFQQYNEEDSFKTKPTVAH